MTRIVRQIYSGREFTVIAEDARQLVLRPIPDDLGPDIILPLEMFAAKWENADGSGGGGRKRAADLAALAKPEPKRRGRR